MSFDPQYFFGGTSIVGSFVAVVWHAYGILGSGYTKLQLESFCLWFGTHRDRKQTELELQNARRKETRDMARDLESQLTTVQRTAEVITGHKCFFVSVRRFCGGLIAHTP